MGMVSVDPQGRIVLPREIRRRFGIDGCAGQLRLVETPDGVLLEAPPANATIVVQDDGFPSVTIEGLAEPVENTAVIEAIAAERAAR